MARRNTQGDGGKVGGEQRSRRGAVSARQLGHWALCGLAETVGKATQFVVDAQKQVGAGEPTCGMTGAERRRDWGIPHGGMPPRESGDMSPHSKGVVRADDGWGIHGQAGCSARKYCHAQLAEPTRRTLTGLLTSLEFPDLNGIAVRKRGRSEMGSHHHGMVGFRVRIPAAPLSIPSSAPLFAAGPLAFYFGHDPALYPAAERSRALSPDR